MIDCLITGRGMGTRATLIIGGRPIVDDLWVLADGSIEPRRAPRRHNIGPREALRVAMDVQTLIVGTGCLNQVQVGMETRKALAARGISLITAPTPEAVAEFNGLATPRAAIFHTCC